MHTNCACKVKLDHFVRAAAAATRREGLAENKQGKIN